MNFQHTLTGPATKWYIEKPSTSHGNFSSLATVFLTFFQLPIHHDSVLELLTHFKQTPATHLSDHIHEWWKRRSFCKDKFEDKVLLDLFLRSLTSEIAEDVEKSFSLNKEEYISKGQ